MEEKHELKPIISQCYREWEEQATLEEKQKACDEINGIAAVLRAISNENNLK